MRPADIASSMARQLAPSLYWEDFAVGSQRCTHPAGEGYTFTSEEVIFFAQRFDPQYFHLDAEAAKASLFGGLCASGWHTASVAMRLMCDGWNLDTASLGSPGVENLRWLKPVMVGDTVRLSMVVTQARSMASRPHVGMLFSESTLLNQRDEPVMTMQAWSMLKKRPSP